ncbi:MAG: glyS [Rickettsiaceae bacterium]|jgi:glycyl-tRNA synthetase beta chain|nr:glyS [Rickettsiaceae bacterium]
MTELLLELYSEEIPALMQPRAEQNFKKLFSDAFFSKNISFSELKVFSGPCRITIYATGLCTEIPGYLVEKKGPRVGSDAKAIEGFAKSVGQELNNLEIQEVKGAECYVYRENIPARPTETILPEVINQVLTDYVWPKSMFWGEYKLAWIRPIKNILCLYNNEVLAINFKHLRSNNITFGHKFLRFTPIEVNSFEDYKTKLKENLVILDREERKTIIRQQTDALLNQHNLVLNQDEGLLEEVAGLVEYPKLMLGTIPEKFLTVPHEILTSAMRMHQKYFTVSDKSGKFAPYFIFASNIDASDNVVKGNEKVLSARLADAKFFYELDLKTSLEAMYERLSKVTFHAKLGTLKDKVDRVGKIASFLAPTDKALAVAAKFCKCDLVSGVVSEFPELQGIIGRYYATSAGLSSEIAQAISDHYQPLGPNDNVPTGTSAYLAIADKLDSLVALSLAGEKATGSGDPFALRRYALGVINTILANNMNISLIPIVEFTLKQVVEAFPALAEDKMATKSIISFLEDRVKNLLKDKYEVNLVNACVKLTHDSNLLSIVKKLEALQNFTTSEQGGILLQSFKRAYNILSQEEKKFKAGISDNIDETLLKDSEEIELVKFINPLKKEVSDLLASSQLEQALGKLSSLHSPLGRFFDKVIVVSSDIQLTENRLSILKSIVNIFNKLANFNELV